jgi:TetR/AcrR family transcriptional regulator, transcriptional repressor for nem operon
VPAEALQQHSHRTRDALLDAGVAVAEEHGLAGLSVNRVVARAGVAKGTFYVHFADRATFVDALHERFHARVQEAVRAATAGVDPGAEHMVHAAEAYLDVCLAEPAVKALALEARSDPSLAASMAARHERFVGASVSSFRAIGWPDARAASQLFAAMTAEIAVRELDAGRRLPAARRSLRRFLGITGQTTARTR